VLKTEWEIAREREAIRYRAHFAVRLAVADGRLPRAKTQTCSGCGGVAHHYHHYVAYTPQHWLDVVPMCRSCHGKADHSGVLYE
jgi:transposase